MASSTPAQGPRRWGRWIVAGATTAVLATVVALAVVWQGFDAQQTPVQDSSVWALQTGDGRRYAKINTALGEVATVKDVENPSGIAQSSGRLFVYTDGNTKFADVSLSSPTDLDADNADAFQSTPSGTSDVVSAGDYVAYLTDSGDVYGTRLSTGGSTTAINPYADEEVPEGQERQTLQADAVTVTSAGLVYAVSLANQSVVTARAATGEILSQDAIDTGDATDVQISAAGENWVVYDADGTQLWSSARDEPVTVDAQPGALLQQPGTDAGTVYLADTAGLLSVALDGSGDDRVVETSGTPAAPTTSDGTVFAAWLGVDSGTLWSSEAGTTDLEYGGASLGDEITPQLTVNGTTAILNETVSGWVWTLPDGALVASSQQWDSDDTAQQEQDQQQESERVIDPKPPVAVDDTFGVRAGRDVVLSVLLNDHDANEDVLTILPESVTGLDPGFGTLVTTNQNQQLVVSVAAGATGSATFSYRITDGTSADGLNSDPATVTLTVVPDSVNNAPVWCGVDGCLATWPSPQVAPGGTVDADVLDGWVDPDGDPIYLSDAVNESGVGSVAADPGGTVTYQHPDPYATESLSVQIDLTVSDSLGATAEKAMTVSVTGSPQLTADSFAATGSAGTPVTVDLSSRVHGANGSVTLTSAKALTEGAGTVTANSADLSFVFSSAQAGSFVLQYTVADATTEVSATVRVTLVDPATAQISTPPLTAFVRPNEDSSVDVIASVTNPAGLVLLVSDLLPEPSGTASLNAATVGQNLIRVSGATDDGQPGTLGTVRYTVSDGSGSAGGTTTGELTVVLLPTATAEPPIAVDDTVTVRAGAQVDIPVLDNDAAPAGALIALDASAVVNESDAGLAFATPDVVRYLAPDEAGTYSLSYTVYRLGFPEMTDTARVFITVLSADANTAPVPTDLEGRVLSGESVSIEVDGYGIDPDGDTVTLDKLTTQPAHGSAAISATGDAIVYTSTPGSSGQDSFTYQVRDAYGATATATVRIGILDAESDPSPVTYSDYAQAQAGADSTVVVSPVDNDVDPAGSELSLIQVEPNAQAGTAEYDALEAMLAEVDTDSGEVRLSAGTELGTYSFVYTVRNVTGDTAQGLIVLKVVRNAVPDYPVVTDTVLTAETREDLPSGVDVISGKVSWSGGDVSALTLSLWGDSSGLSVDGWKISGSVPGESRIVAFEVTGTSFSGEQVVSYGFLRIPGDDDIQLTLRSSFADVQVDENGSVEVDLSQAVAVPSGRTLQVGDGVSAGGARANAQCSLVSGTVVRYDAGAGAPWSDTCTVPVKLDSQDEYTYLALRVTVVAADPQPELRAASQSVSPGAQIVYDLTTMTTWQGHSDLGSLPYTISYSGDQFDIVQSGTQLTITAKDAARPSRQEPVVVRLTDYPDAAAATLTLTVGPAPSTLPKGGTVTQQCSQSGGNTSCTIQVIGGGGEVNPLPGTPLTLVSVTGSTNCGDVSFSRASDTTVTATWSSTAAGAGDCTGTFVVQDAQGRQSSGDRNGTVILDLQGLPTDPAQVTWTAYTGTSVTLAVVPGASSYPAVTGYRVTGSNGTTVACDATGKCPAISATNGEKVTYEAWAVNSVGESRGSVSITAWAYQAPAAPTSVSAAPSGDLTATITVSGIDTSTGQLQVTSPNGGSTTIAVPAGQTSVVVPSFAVGANSETTVTVTPMTKYDVPTDVAGGSSVGTVATVTAWGVGSPIFTNATATPSLNGTGRIQVSTNFQTNGVNATLYATAVLSGASCSPATAVSNNTFTATVQGSVWSAAAVTICAEYRVDDTVFGSSSWSSDSVTPAEDINDPSGAATYSITGSPTITGGGSILTWATVNAPSLSTSQSGYRVVYFVGGTPYEAAQFSSIFSLGVSPGTITAKSCLNGSTSTCSAGVTVSAATNSAKYTAQVSFPAGCPADPTSTAPNATKNPNNGDLMVTVTPTTNTTMGTITFTYSVSFSGGLSGLSAPSTHYALTCTAPDTGDTDTGDTDTGDTDTGTTP